MLSGTELRVLAAKPRGILLLPALATIDGGGRTLRGFLRGCRPLVTPRRDSDDVTAKGKTSLERKPLGAPGSCGFSCLGRAGNLTGSLPPTRLKPDESELPGKSLPPLKPQSRSCKTPKNPSSPSTIMLPNLQGPKGPLPCSRA